jgi:hypothetical protein
MSFQRSRREEEIDNDVYLAHVDYRSEPTGGKLRRLRWVGPWGTREPVGGTVSRMGKEEGFGSEVERGGGRRCWHSADIEDR